MHIKQLHKKRLRVKTKINIGWLIFTIGFLLFLQYHILSYYQSKKLHNFQTSAHQLAFKFDEMVEAVLETVSVIPFYKNDLTSCDKTLKLQLQTIVFTHPNISGIAISDINNNILCATSHFITELPKPVSASPVILGPLKMDDSSTQVFLLQQRLGQYHISLYLVKPYIVDFLKQSASNLDYEGMFDTLNQRIVYENNDHSHHINFNSLQNETESTDNDGHFLLKIPLHNVDNVDLVVTSPTLDLNKQTVFYLLFIGLSFLVISGLLHRYFMKLIDKKYSIEQALQNALKNNQLRPMYQAIRDEKNHCFCGAEVLLRWHTDFNEIIMPDHFIPDAEQSNIIVPITLQLIEKAFQDCESLLLHRQDFHLSFNLSPNHFHDATFFDKFYALCQQYKIKSTQIVLELTERQLFNKQDKPVVEQMQALTQRGFALSLDDFGTGQSNIQYLEQFPFTYLKIDKLFISSIGTGAITETLNLSIINMANALGLHVVAEGVENKTQLDYLIHHGVTLIQGWYYCKALPFDEFMLLIETDKIG